MTDEQIIKALECCKHDDCDNCPNCFGNCESNLATHSLDLINRQKAEIERLEKENIALNRRAMPASGTILSVGNALLFAENKEDYDITINTIKAEAIKEFENKILELFPFDKNFTTISRFTVKQITKEMTEAQSEQRNT